jgi:hypothetical protein
MLLKPLQLLLLKCTFRTPTPAKVSDTNPISLVMQKGYSRIWFKSYELALQSFL